MADAEQVQDVKAGRSVTAQDAARVAAERVIAAAYEFIDESGSALVDGKARWVGDVYSGGKLAAAVFYLRSARARAADELSKP